MRSASLAFGAGERATDALRAFVNTPIAAAFDSIDYLNIVDSATLEPAAARAPTSSMLLVAARIGSTRLIDNCLLGEECLEERA
jgi:pantothenate synthetase